MKIIDVKECKQYIKLVKNKLLDNKEVKNAQWIIGGKAAQMILSFFVSIWATRYLGPDNYGTISYASGYVTFFASLSTLGINHVIIKDFIDHPDEQGKAIGTTLFLRFLSSILSTIIIIGIVNIINRNEPITITVTTLCSIALFFQVADTLNYWFQSKYMSKVVSVATLFAYIATTIYRIVLLVYHKDVSWFAFASSIDYIFLAIILFMAYHKYGGPKLSISFKKGMALLKKSYNFIIILVLVSIYQQTDKIMLKQMISETEVGYYSLAATVNSMWGFVLVAIIDSLSPTIFRYETKDEKLFECKNRQLYAIIIYISLLMALIFTCFGEKIICIIYGETYFGAVTPLKIICWFTAFSYLVSARNIWFVAKNRQKYLRYAYAGAALANVGLNALFIPALGASGAALATLITQIVAIIIIPFFIKDMKPNAKLMLDALLLRNLK